MKSGAKRKQEKRTSRVSKKHDKNLIQACLINSKHVQKLMQKEKGERKREMEQEGL